MNPIPDVPVLPGPPEVVIERIQQALMGLTRCPRVTKKELIRHHLAEIQAAHARGVSFAEIARTLTTAGCALSPRLLRKYLDDIRRKENTLQEKFSLPLATPAEVSDANPEMPMPLSATGATPAPVKTRSLRRSALILTRKDNENDQ